MKTDFPLTLLYDGACPVCALEMDHLRARNGEGRLVLIDIATPGFDAATYGTTHAALDAEIHGIQADGTVIQGLGVLRLAYAAVGLGWVLRATGFRPLKPLFDLGYRLFARHRKALSAAAAPGLDWVRARRARRMAAAMAGCQSGACELPPAVDRNPREHAS